MDLKPALQDFERSWKEALKDFERRMTIKVGVMIAVTFTALYFLLKHMGY
jgi:hypothetical protein